MWILRNGLRIRVDMYVDPCWNNDDIMSARNLFARFITSGYSKSDASSFAATIIWKRKWPDTTYSKPLEQSLLIKH